ncbi:MAG TPA: NADH-ubiquinone oxidoreductase-F iron-sulfur binding region domain-containing protein [Pseudonocardia sp.]
MTALATGPMSLVGAAAVESFRLFAAAPDPRMTADLDMHLSRFGPLPLGDYPGGAGRRILVEKVARAGLRGRGGGGFPLAEKMAVVNESKRTPTVVANGCESDPSSAKDRVLLHRAPHLVLDGIALAAHAVGAKDAVLALHADSPLTAVLMAALRERGGDPVPVQLAEMPQGFVASESTALVNTLNTGDPRPTGVRTSVKGVRGRPTLVANVETLAHLALIARFGERWYRTAGTEGSPGTTLATVSGAVNRPGVHEIEMGLPVSDLLELAGGETEPLRAVLIGGLGGSWLPSDDALELALAHETCADVGIQLGVTALIALPASACGVSETAMVLQYLADASAGQCGPCMFGLPAIAADMATLADGIYDRDLLPRLKRRLGVIPGRGACSHPDGAARLAASALHTFADDVAAHARGVPCAASGLGPWTPIGYG